MNRSSIARTRPYRASSSVPPGGKTSARVVRNARVKLVRSQDFKALLGVIDEMTPAEGWPADFSPSSWLENWLQQPVRALGNKRPVDYLGTQDGLMQVSRALWAMTGHIYL